MPVSLHTATLPLSALAYDAEHYPALTAAERKALKSDLPGSSIRNAEHRAEHLAALGIVIDESAGTITAPVRHNLPQNLLKSGKKIGKRADAIGALAGADALALAKSAGICPVLHAAGVTAADQYAAQIDNGKDAAADRTMRAESIRCPVCLAGDVLAKMRAGAERDAEAIWYGDPAAS